MRALVRLAAGGLPFGLAAALLTVLAGPAAVRAQERYSSEDYRAVGRALVCQCGGCNALVHECAMDRCPSSNPIREEIAERLQAGDPPDSVIAMFTERYGLAILAAPPTSGFHLSAWIVPGVVLIGGAVAAVSLLRRWRQEGPDDDGAGGAGGEDEDAVEASAEVLDRIERDVAAIR